MDCLDRVHRLTSTYEYNKREYKEPPQRDPSLSPSPLAGLRHRGLAAMHRPCNCHLTGRTTHAKTAHRDSHDNDDDYYFVVITVVKTVLPEYCFHPL